MVDDDMINLKLAEKALNEGGIRVTSLTSGKALLEYIDNNEVLPDLILLDIKMPEMDGYEAMSRLISKGPDVAKIPVIFLTADESDGAEVKGLDLGAMDFLRKPFVPEILRLRVNHILELVMLRKRYHR
jgi:CheY-like chemotaxis protein